MGKAKGKTESKEELKRKHAEAGRKAAQTKGEKKLKEAGRKAVITKGPEELKRAGKMAAWTKKHGKNDAKNPFTKDKELVLS